MAKIYNKVCIEPDCGRAFEARANCARRCPECAKKRKKAITKELQQKERARRIAQLKALQAKYQNQRAPQPKKSINQVMKELAEYNREHKTNLTYGQYILLTEGGKPSGKRRN